MSEGTPEPADPGTGQADGGSPGAGTDPEDDDASRLLAGMAEQDPDRLTTEIAKWKALARKHEGRAKDNAAAAKELAELKQSQMSEVERANKEREDAIRERDEARADHSRVMAAATHDLPVELIDFLGAGTDEEINARAEAIAGAIETRAQEIAQGQQEQGSRNGPPGARPVESMRAGSAPSGGAAPKTADEWFRKLVQGRE